jgi:hypothetical protein
MNHTTTTISPALLTLQADEVTPTVYSACVIVHYGFEELLSHCGLFGLFVFIAFINALFGIVD